MSSNQYIKSIKLFKHQQKTHLPSLQLDLQRSSTLPLHRFLFHAVDKNTFYINLYICSLIYIIFQCKMYLSNNILRTTFNSSQYSIQGVMTKCHCYQLFNIFYETLPMCYIRMDISNTSGGERV